MKIAFGRGKEMKYFTGAAMLILLLSCIPWTVSWYQKLMPVSLAYGIFILVRIFFVDRSVYRNKFFLPLFLFGISYGATILLNYQANLLSNVGQLAYTCVYFFVCFCQFSQMEEKDRTQTLVLLFRIISVFSLAMAIIALCMMFVRYSGQIELNGTTILLGFHQRNTGMQLSGVVMGPTSLSGIGLLGMVSLLAEAQLLGKRLRAWRIAGIVVLFLTVCAANAYVGLLKMLAFSVVVIFCFVFAGTAGIGRKMLLKRAEKAAVLMVAACAVVVGVYFAAQTMETAAVNGITHLSEQITAWQESQKQEQPPSGETPSTETPTTEPPSGETPSTEDPSTETPSTETPSTEEPSTPPQQDITIHRELSTSANGSRSAIWREGIKLFLAHPLGVTNSNISVKIFYGVPDYEYNNLHNGYLTLLAGSGIVGFVLILVFGLLLLRRTLCSLFSQQDRQKGRTLGLLVAICVAILAGDLVNGCFVLWRGSDYLLLWLLLGAVYAMTESEQGIQPKEAVSDESAAKS